MEFIAKTFHGLEEILTDELKQIGAKKITPLKRAASFEGDLETLYKASLHLRTALRIITPVLRFKAQNEDQLYKNVLEYEWDTIFDVDRTFAIDSTVYSSYFNHSKYVALKTKDAIADYFRKKYNKRPNVDRTKPEFSFNVHVAENQVVISLDSSGPPLNRRGYRPLEALAPLNECLAAGMILLSDWNRETPLMDPMCGSGTILMEAAMIAKNMAPNLNRKYFGFMKWKNFDDALWNSIKEEAKKNINTEDRFYFYGSDESMRAIDQTRKSLIDFRLNFDVQLKKTKFENLNPPQKKGVIIMNPPYGERVQKDEIEEFYRQVGTILKHKYSGWEAWILSSNFAALKKVGLKPSKKIILFNGPLECRYQKFELYEGTMKKGKEDGDKTNNSDSDMQS